MADPAPREPASGTRLTEIEIHDNVLVAAEEELHRPAWELFCSAVEAGLTIGFSFVAAGWLAAMVPDGAHDAAVAVAYPLGFVFVVLARSQLFTENTLEPVIPLLNRRDRETALLTIKLWAAVLTGNLVGALAFAIVVARTPMLRPSVHAALGTIAATATDGGFGLVAYQAIFGGWLVALMAWLVSSTRQTGAQIALVWLTTAPIAAFGFRHSIVGSVEAFYRAAAGTATWGDMVAHFIVPAVLGNVAGGVVIVALFNYGQVVATRQSGGSAGRHR